MLLKEIKNLLVEYWREAFIGIAIGEILAAITLYIF